MLLPTCLPAQCRYQVLYRHCIVMVVHWYLYRYAGTMFLSDRQLLDVLSQMLVVDSAELAGTLGEPPAPVHRALTGLLTEGIVGSSATVPHTFRRAKDTTCPPRASVGPTGFSDSTFPSTSCEPTPRRGSGLRRSFAGWTRWPPSAD